MGKLDPINQRLKPDVKKKLKLKDVINLINFTPGVMITLCNRDGLPIDEEITIVYYYDNELELYKDLIVNSLNPRDSLSLEIHLDTSYDYFYWEERRKRFNNE